SIKSKDFPLFDSQSRFTDDTVLTLAVAEAILTGEPYCDCVRSIGRRYPGAGYGGNFRQWLFSDESAPYNSWGNGSAMRVGAVGLAFDDEATVLREARESAAITHNHPEGIKGAQATALAIYMARHGISKESIRREISRRFDYDLDRRIDEIRPDYSFDVSCQGSVPEAIIAFLDSESWEDTVRNAVSLGGDADTLACIAGGIAQAWYGDIGGDVRSRVEALLPPDLLDVLQRFETRYGFRKRREF
ncbi:MAG: ADP-ribosylglycohydrolase family protein, partial [Proteobacteria bacterium]|nr:ADP-ribosylglycohydrolase family protein [Pseudomonadota bacterium]